MKSTKHLQAMPTPEQHKQMRERDKQAARERLCSSIAPGDAVSTRIKHRAASYQVLELGDSKGKPITNDVCKAAGYRFDKKRGGLGVGGVDSGPEVVRRLAKILFDDDAALIHEWGERP